MRTPALLLLFIVLVPAAADTWHMAVGLPDAVRARVRTGGFDVRCDVLIMDAITVVGTFRPPDFVASNSQSATLAQLSILHDVRARRLSDNASAIVSFEWVVLLLGAACITSYRHDGVRSQMDMRL